MQNENKSSLFKIIKPWEIDTELPEYRWALYYLKDRKIPDFVFSKPSVLMEERIEFLITQVCTKSRKWIVCFSDSVTYIRTLYAYTVATFVLSTNLNAEIKNPQGLMEFAFGKQSFLPADGELPIQTCALLMFPCFEATHPGYIKARPKIIELLTDRKMQMKPFICSLYNEILPRTNKDALEKSAPLVDFFGWQAKDLFGDRTTKYVILKGE